MNYLCNFLIAQFNPFSFDLVYINVGRNLDVLNLKSDKIVNLTKFSCNV